MTRQGNTLLLAARGFSGALTSSSTVGDGSLQTVNGENEPLAGWNYIAFREGSSDDCVMAHAGRFG